MAEEETTIHTKLDFKQVIYNIIMMIARDSWNKELFVYRVACFESTISGYLDQEYFAAIAEAKKQYTSELREAFDPKYMEYDKDAQDMAEWNMTNRKYQALIKLAKRKDLTPPEAVNEDLGEEDGIQ